MIANIRIDRWVNFTKGARIDLFGFSDASMKAHAAVIYARVWNGKRPFVNIVASKTKLAPILMDMGSKVTLPRLDLFGAVLRAKLMKTVKEWLKLQIHTTKYYSDSEITLAWIKSSDLNRRIHSIRCV